MSHYTRQTATLQTPASPGVLVRLPDAPPARTPRPTPAPLRRGVLVVQGTDGFLEVFASPGVRVHVAERLDVQPGDEILAESYLEAGLPAWARELYCPRDLVATLFPRPATPAEELDKVTELAALRGLRELGAQRKGGPPCQLT